MILLNRPELTNEQKQQIVVLFLGDPLMGEVGISELATKFNRSRAGIEQVLREAIKGLLKLNTDAIQELADVETANAILEDANAD